MDGEQVRGITLAGLKGLFGDVHVEERVFLVHLLGDGHRLPLVPFNHHWILQKGLDFGICQDVSGYGHIADVERLRVVEQALRWLLQRAAVHAVCNI